jgi:Fe-S oxidoreductase
MLELARRRLVEILEALRPALREGLAVVGLEPSCISVFRDELPNMFPDDPDARLLRDHSFLLGAFLLREVPGWTAPRLERKAVVHGHCHHKAVLGFADDRPLFEKLGLATEMPDPGCCGMAGAFGYERDHYEVSVACGERQLLPAVRHAPEDMLIVADGFSCREQIRQQTGRRALHTAQLLQMARQQGPRGPAGPHPERGYVDVRLPVPWRRRVRNAVVLGLGVAAAAALVRRRLS